MAEGEFQAAEKLAAAGTSHRREPAALQLRYLQSLAEVGGEGRSTIVFPVPVDMMKSFLERDRSRDEDGQLWSSGS